MALLEFTDANFAQAVEKSTVTVLVDFFAIWCGPCRQIAPIIEELAKEFEGKSVKIGKLDVDQNPETAEKYGVMSIPALMIFKNGQVIEQLKGVQPKTVLVEKLNALM